MKECDVMSEPYNFKISIVHAFVSFFAPMLMSSFKMLITLLFSVTYIKVKHAGPRNIRTYYSHKYPCFYAICTCSRHQAEGFILCRLEWLLIITVVTLSG